MEKKTGEPIEIKKSKESGEHSSSLDSPNRLGNHKEPSEKKSPTFSLKMTSKKSIAQQMAEHVPDAVWDFPLEAEGVIDSDSISGDDDGKKALETAPEVAPETTSDADMVMTGKGKKDASADDLQGEQGFAAGRTVNPAISPAISRRRKGLLILPVFVLPLVSLAFWALVENKEPAVGPVTMEEGLNMTVPRASLSQKTGDKMTLYKEAAQQRKEQGSGESSGQGNEQLNNPLDGGSRAAGGFLAGSFSGDGTQEADLGRSVVERDYEDPHTRQVEEKIAKLQALIHQPGTADYGYNSSGSFTGNTLSRGAKFTGVTGGSFSKDDPELHTRSLEELQGLKELVAGTANNEKGQAAGDPEAREINQMLDKVLAIQKGMQGAGASVLPDEQGADIGSTGLTRHREYVNHVIRPGNELGVPLLAPSALKDPGQEGGQLAYAQPAANTGTGVESVTGLAAPSYSEDTHDISGGFYDIDGGEILMDSSDGGRAGKGTIALSGIPALVTESQTLVSGAAVKLQLESATRFGGTLLPKGSFIYGTATVAAERLKVMISHVRTGSQLLPVNLRVFDMDGMEGIRIPGSINRDAAKQGADRALSSMQLMSMDPNLATQAASAGIEAAKGLLSKKVKLVRVTVKAGYPVLLVDANSSK